MQSWVDQQRTEASIRTQAGDTEVELQVSGRTDSARLLAQATEALRAAQATEALRAARELGSEPGPDAVD
ncbi:hypothetical protein [Micromonospora arida]|uniref:YbaB/EbfC family DNA-binding protein n=1 Tax=Micromonospora arida TaxID=2203715 RepID=A0A3N9WWF0_9ACTN|nr:hypothetical protein [Micromonospora arida]RQX05131.1 hypothetical protein DLJ58_26245 [Micromonospora arida]